jgi:hypothetical protein
LCASRKVFFCTSKNWRKNGKIRKATKERTKKDLGKLRHGQRSLQTILEKKVRKRDQVQDPGLQNLPEKKVRKRNQVQDPDLQNLPEKKVRKRNQVQDQGLQNLPEKKVWKRNLLEDLQIILEKKVQNGNQDLQELQIIPEKRVLNGNVLEDLHTILEKKVQNENQDLHTILEKKVQNENQDLQIILEKKVLNGNLHVLLITLTHQTVAFRSCLSRVTKKPIGLRNLRLILTSIETTNLQLGLLLQMRVGKRNQDLVWF